MEGRSPLLLTERIDHLEQLAELLEGRIRNVVVLRGGMGKKQRVAAAKSLDDVGDNRDRVIVATGRYIGEGFDDARLARFFLPCRCHGEGLYSSMPVGFIECMMERKKF
ncbi:MAG: hypothetical protein R3261_07055 [Alphaproteobacteria bacterium]|nr:hypothetical protein [Alphaproteobacteria bacterium]